MQFAPANLDSAVVITFDAIVKAVPDLTGKGRRILETECSVEAADLEGDCISQQALLEAAPEFIKSGHVDVDHISELGARYSIPNPESYIVGKPIEVKNIGDKRTSVVFELFHSPDGKHDPSTNKYDAVFDAIKNGIDYRSSIFGYPLDPDNGGLQDCRDGSCPNGVTRFFIKKIFWKSLALTRTPVCDAIKSPVRIISAKSFALELAKSGVFPTYPPPPSMSQMDATNPIQNQGPFVQSLLGAPDASTQELSPMTHPAADMPVAESMPIGNFTNDLTPGGASFHMPAPRNLSDAVGQHGVHMRECPHTGGYNSTPGFREHFIHCCGMAKDDSELFAHALQHFLNLSRKRV